MHSIGFGKKITLIFSLLMLVVILTIGFVTGVYSANQMEAEIGKSLAETANQMSSQLDYFMWSRSGEIEILLSMDAFRKGQEFNEIELMLNQLKKTFPSFSWIGYTNRDGIVKAATDGILVEHDISKRPVFVEGRAGTFIGDVHEAVLLAELLPNPEKEPLKFVDISFDEQSRALGSVCC